jgi:nucleotide-binding universal stress UspA family protein
LVAWKDTIEARRATAFALPLLRTSERVTVAGIPEGKFDRNTTTTSVTDIKEWLHRHGIVCSTIVPDMIGNVSEQLEKIALETSADIVVAGAYGRSPTRERILGGITRGLLFPALRCSFLAH